MAHICPQATRVARNKAFHFKGFIGLFLKTITCIVWSNNQKKGPLGFFSIPSGYLVSCFEFFMFTLINMVGYGDGLFDSFER